MAFQSYEDYIKKYSVRNGKYYFEDDEMSKKEYDEAMETAEMLKMFGKVSSPDSTTTVKKVFDKAKAEAEDKVAAPVDEDPIVIEDGVLKKVTGVVGEYVVPKGIHTIGPFAFNNSDVESIILTDEVKKLKVGAFENCHTLKRIVIPESITQIPLRCFQDCLSLEEIVFPSKVKFIGNSAFNNCINLKSIKLPNTVVSIGESVFEFCRELSEVELSENISKIPLGVFKGCSKLVKIIIPKSVEYIEYDAFRACGLLSDVYLSKDTEVDDDAFYGCTIMNPFHYYEDDNSDNPIDKLKHMSSF